MACVRAGQDSVQLEPVFSTVTDTEHTTAAVLVRSDCRHNGAGSGAESAKVVRLLPAPNGKRGLR